MPHLHHPARTPPPPSASTPPMAPQHRYPLVTRPKVDHAQSFSPGSEKADPLERTESEPTDAPGPHRPPKLRRSRSTGDIQRQHHAHHTEHLEGRGWQSRLLDWIVHLQKPEPNERHERVWLHDYQRAPEWLELFYDLVIVAVLSVFSGTHEVSTGQSVAVYFSYFIIIWWVWASQTLYDVHFQANDWLHRLFKGAQLAAFAFIGACAAQFDPWSVTWAGEVSQEGAIIDAKANSFRGVAIAYAVGRALLVTQYLFVSIRLLIPVKNQNLREYKGHLSLALFPAVVYGISGALWITAALLTVSQPAKLALVYSGIFIEFLSVLFQPLLPGYIKPPAEMISERFGALTLIILGEGIIGLIRSFSFVISGFGFTNTAYLQCFCALIIVFGAWHFMFHGFSTENFRLKRRSGALWLVLHLPLHFSILLLFAGIRTATVYGNMVDAMTEVQGQLSPIIKAMQAGDLELATVQSQNEWMTMQLGKLDMPTPWEEEVDEWQKAIGNHTVPVVDLTISSYGYIAEIWLAIAESFEVELSDTLVNETQAILNLNDTWVASAPGRIALENADYSMYTQFIDDFSIEIAQGVLFFFPAAGGLISLCSLQILLRAAPLGLWMWAAWLLQFCAGIVLCLLGFLGAGNQFQNPADEATLLVYKLLDLSWLMPIVAIIYAFLIFAEYWLLRFAKWTDPRYRAASQGSVPQSPKEIEEGTSAIQEIPEFRGGNGTNSADEAHHSPEE